MKSNQAHYEEAVEEALCFGWIDGLGRRIDIVDKVTTHALGADRLDEHGTGPLDSPLQPL